jgi:hypothetical protein
MSDRPRSIPSYRRTAKQTYRYATRDRSQGRAQTRGRSQGRAQADRYATRGRPKTEPKPPGILSDKQKSAVADAIKALARIQAAVQVGVTFPKYSELVIDAKAAMNEAERLLPRGELLTNLDVAMQAYSDASTVWNHKIQHGVPLSKGYGHGEIMTRYNLPIDDRGGVERADPDLAMQIMWKIAATKLAAARDLQ